MTDLEETTDPPEPAAGPEDETPGHRRSRFLLAGMLLGMGILHVVVPAPFERIIPRWLGGNRRAWVYASGAAELGSGALLLSRRTERLGGAAAAVTIAGVYPANIQMALDTGVPSTPGGWATWLRLPLQLPMIAWALRHARSRS